MQTLTSPKTIPDRIARVIPRSIWIPFLYLAIQTTRGLMFWVDVVGGKDTTDVDAAQAQMEGSPIDRVILSALILVALWILRKRGDRILQFLKSNVVLMLLIMFMLASVAWSDFHVIALKRWVRLFGLVVMIMLVFTEDHPLQYIQRLIEMLALFLIIGSVVLILFFPSLGKEIWSTGEVQWLGLAVHKNMLGQYGALGSVFFMWRVFYAEGFRKKAYYFVLLGIALSALILYGSKSFTSVSVTVLGIAVLLALEFSRLLGKLGGPTVLLFLAMLLTGGYMVQNSVLDKPISSYLLEAGGKDETFTGRTDIWNLALRNINGKELLVGSGYESYWIGKKAEHIRQALSWEFYSAHNGYIDLFLQLGAIGAGLFLAYLVSVVLNLLKCRSANRDMFILWSAFLLISVVSNFFESNFLVSSDIYWFLTLVAGISPKCYHLDAIEPAPAAALGHETSAALSSPG